MLHLELKIPPPVVALFFGVTMWAIARVTPEFTWLQGFTVPCVLLATGGLIVIIAGILSIRKAGTTINPTKPESSSALVIGGIYRYTRNPMYLGLLVWLTAWGLYLANGFSMALCIAFVLYMNRFQIRPEERALTNVFGEAYLAYMSRVSRWL